MNIFDSHLHIISPSFPLVSNDGFLPDYFTVENYLSRMGAYNLKGGAVVSGSFQGFDQSYLIDSLKKLGKNYVGVTQLPASVSDNELHQLNGAGVRGVRFNLVRGGSEHISQLEYFANRLFDIVGWHVELYASTKDIEDIKHSIISLPSVSIDHLGLCDKGVDLLLFLAGRNVRVKATGFGRVNFDVGDILQKIYRENPDSLMFGSDLPSTRAKRPFEDGDITLITELFNEQQADKIFYKNARHFYRM